MSEQTFEGIDRAATADPSAEASLLRHAALDDAASFRRRCAQVRAAAERDEAAARERIRRARRFRSWTDAEGAFCFAGRGLAEDGAALLAAMKRHQDQAFRDARRSGDHGTTEAYAYDALMALARRDAAHRCPPTARGATGAHDATDGGTSRLRPHDPEDWRGPDDSGRRPAGPDDAIRRDWPGRTTDPSQPSHVGDTLFPAGAGSSGAGTPDHDTPGADDGYSHDRDVVLAGCFRPGPKAKLIVRIDHSALVRGHTVSGEICEIEGVGPVSVATARELARDAFLTAVVTDGTDIRSVVHLGRAATAHQRTALEARGIRCAVPGCGLVHGLEIDHVDGWAITRRTHIDQLDWLCAFHHGQKTHKSYRLAGPPGDRTWHPPGEPDP